ncbi:MAG: pyruvate carboxylase subunit B [bacterium]|nr:pyruvate carboxylase subunit B [bacterium]
MLKITDTTLRDAQQSIWAKHFKINEIIPLLKDLDECGFEALEVWGGGTFESALRLWKENPWDRLRKIKKNIKKTPLKMMLRGRHLVGYHVYSNEVIEEFIKHSIDCGISIISIFDPLNDISNIKNIIKIIKSNNAKVQGLICYSISDEYDLKYYLNYAKALEKAGVDSLTIKDPAGILPYNTGIELFKRIKESTNIEVNFHGHITNGIANITTYEMIKAGVDGVDTSMGPLSFPAAQPSIENLLQLPVEVNINREKVEQISAKIADLCFRKEITKTYYPFNTHVLFKAQLTRGSFSFLYQQLSERNALDKLSIVLNEIQAVRNDLGNPPMLTPISQIITAQAIYNVLMGERYKLIPREIKEFIRGYYGTPKGKISEELKKLVSDEKNIVEENAESKKHKKTATKKFHSLKNDVAKEYIQDETDYLTYAIFPDLAIEYFKYRNDPSVLDKIETPEESTISTEEEIMVLNKIMTEKGVVEFELNQEDHYISIKKFSDENNTEHYTYMPPAGSGQQKTQNPHLKKQTKQDPTNAKTIKTPIFGIFYATPKPSAPNYVKAGDTVSEGQTLCIIEAMKVMNEIKAPYNCKIINTLVKDRASVTSDQDLFTVEEITH